MSVGMDRIQACPARNWSVSVVITSSFGAVSRVAEVNALRVGADAAGVAAAMAAVAWSWTAAADALAKGAAGAAIEAAGRAAAEGGGTTADAMGVAPTAAEAGDAWGEDRRLQSRSSDSQTLFLVENPP